MTFVLAEPWSDGLSILFRITEVFCSARTAHQRVLIAQTECYGRALFLDDLVQSTEADEALYHEPFVHPAFVIHGGPQRVLVAGAGEGATLREVLRHGSVREVVAVDLDREVVDACRQHLPTWSAGAFDDPRVTLRFEDVQRTLADAGPDAFDAVLLDVTDPLPDGPSEDLYTTRFFAAVAGALAPDGIMVLQSGEVDPLDLRSAQAIHTTVHAVFGWVQTLVINVPSFHGIWSITLAATSPRATIPDDLEARVAKIAGLRVYDAPMHRALATLPRFIREGLLVPGRIYSGDDAQRWAPLGGRDA